MPGFINEGKLFHITYSALADFEKCPRLYFFRNEFKNERGKIIEILSPDLTLGNIVHDTIDKFTLLPLEKRNGEALKNIFYNLWPEGIGFKGGFKSAEQELLYKDRAKEMLRKFYKAKEFSFKKPIRLNTYPTAKIELFRENDLPVVLSGKTDWVEELEDQSLFVLDFKTGFKKEKDDSLQLPIYAHYVSEVKQKPVSLVGYWYLSTYDKPQILGTENLFVEERIKEVIEKAKIIIKVTQEKSFLCAANGCRWCLEFEDVLKGKAKLVETTWRKELYIFV